jgi:nitrogen fixation/metabolism regulation signal transduction histidine kinase
VTLRARLSLWFSLFAALPLLAVFVPVSLVLRQSLDREHSARLEAAVRAVEGELLRLSAAAAEGTRDLATRPETAALARALADGTAAPAEASAILAGWGTARGLDVLWLGEPDGRVVAAAHLPGRAGDVDPALARLLGSTPPGRAQLVRLERAGPVELERALGLAAWDRTGDGTLRVAGGGVLGQATATRLATLTGGAVALRDAGGAILAEASRPPEEEAPGRHLAWLAGALAGDGRSVPLGPPAAPLGSVELRLASAGLRRAWLAVLGTILGLLLLAVAAAAALGRWLAALQTAPLEALRAASARVAAGDLSARVGLRPEGEVGELVEAFDVMTEELQRGRDRLLASERVAAWREVARALAHELKNPLTPIAMSVELLRDARDRPDFGEILDESTRAIGEEVRRLRRIVDEFSRFARLPAPSLQLVPAGELAQALLALYPTPPPGVELARAVEPGLPGVHADRDQVLQVLHNLVKNALEAMPDGGRLTLGAHLEGDQVVFRVGDTGPGIAPDLLPRLFEPYVTAKAGGTGLGLAIARRIVEEHGGRIEVASRPGAGATFSVRLPVASAT